MITLRTQGQHNQRTYQDKNATPAIHVYSIEEVMQIILTAPMLARMWALFYSHV